ncbi:MAG: antibiotic biosynthesis monooxygenase [Bacteroidia bacterium]|nr:antibiotic biosynthesis monooxygenase [Bacteroidia bacterium]MCX7764535.1 antibiotic biosynthesis monooxygenase [Bacteroidia bacterium]MDW8057830.1 antibiotic biosynthesis monooxygenase family protein [Bacteroidia bacterium]
MLWRWVEIRAYPERADIVCSLLAEQAKRVRRFPGCLALSLYRGENADFYSLSLWESPEALEAYRQSEIFRSFWLIIKKHFRAPAKAVSFEKVSLPKIEFPSYPA